MFWATAFFLLICIKYFNGDFDPFSLLGRLWIVFIFVFGAYLSTREIGQAGDDIFDLRHDCGFLVKADGTEHCVICGHVKWEYLKGPVHRLRVDERSYEKKIVVLCDELNWGRVDYLQLGTNGQNAVNGRMERLNLGTGGQFWSWICMES